MRWPSTRKIVGTRKRQLLSEGKVPIDNKNRERCYKAKDSGETGLRGSSIARKPFPRFPQHEKETSRIRKKTWGTTSSPPTEKL